MSIASEISRLQGAKADIKTAIEGKGVTVPSATKLDGYADLVDAIPQGSTPTGTKQISVTENGTQTENVSGYASAQLNVAVPNSYSAGDEGKVVSNGALVAQGSDTATQNGTVDTTLISSLLVNVSGGSGIKSETGTFTLESDTKNLNTENGISHGLGVIPKLLIIWQETYDSDNAPTANLNAGAVYMRGLMDIEQRLTSSASSPHGFYAFLSIAANSTVCTFTGPTSVSYMPYADYYPSATKFPLFYVANSPNWRAGVTYHYFVSEGAW